MHYFWRLFLARSSKSRQPRFPEPLARYMELGLYSLSCAVFFLHTQRQWKGAVSRRGACPVSVFLQWYPAPYLTEVLSNHVDTSLQNIGNTPGGLRAPLGLATSVLQEHLSDTSPPSIKRSGRLQREMHPLTCDITNACSKRVCCRNNTVSIRCEPPCRLQTDCHSFFAFKLRIQRFHSFGILWNAAEILCDFRWK